MYMEKRLNGQIQLNFLLASHLENVIENNAQRRMENEIQSKEDYQNIFKKFGHSFIVAGDFNAKNFIQLQRNLDVSQPTC